MTISSLRGLVGLAFARLGCCSPAIATFCAYYATQHKFHSYFTGTAPATTGRIKGYPLYDMGHTTTLERHSIIETLKSDLIRSLTTLDTLGLDHVAIHVDQALWSLMSPDEKKDATVKANASFGNILDKRVLVVV